MLTMRMTIEELEELKKALWSGWPNSYHYTVYMGEL